MAQYCLHNAPAFTMLAGRFAMFVWWLEVFALDAVLLVEGFVLEEVAHQVKDGVVADLEVELDGLVAQGLSQMSLMPTTVPH